MADPFDARSLSTFDDEHQDTCYSKGDDTRILTFASCR